MDPETIMETTKECSKAVSKLGGIIEKFFGPRWTKKQADADEYADQKKIDIIRKNPDMNISYADGKLNRPWIMNRSCSDSRPFYMRKRRLFLMKSPV